MLPHRYFYGNNKYSNFKIPRSMKIENKTKLIVLGKKYLFLWMDKKWYDFIW